jgi:vWA-MoxR associated protein C-terminal domain/vWA-MoxR associated protein middle region (VMAP-M) 1
MINLFLQNSLVEVARAEVEKQPHSAYGFGNSVGGRSDAYQPKTTVAGGRFQLCKQGDPNDETIQPGFSGAPVWNREQNCVIGMVATAVVSKDEQKSKAYVIPTQRLQPILKEVDAHWFCDVLRKSLDACSSKDEQHLFEMAIATTLQRCNPNGGDRPWQGQFIDLSTDLAPTLNWETEGRLVQFAVMLAWMEGTSQPTYDQLKGWVEQQNLNFAELLERMTRQMKQQKVSPTNGCEHLMVAVERVETSDDEFRISMWAIPERSTYNPYNPPKPIVSEHVLSTQELPAFLRQTIREEIGKKTPIIHLFVPRTLFCCDVEMLPCNRFGSALGSEYPFVIRTNLKTHPIGYYYYDDWNEKWEQVEAAFDSQTHEVVRSINCSVSEKDLITELANTCAATLEKCDSVGELFDLVSEETALPVALWSRHPQFQDQLATVLDCVVEALPDRIRQERDAACKSEEKQLLGHHLSLVWEDPKIVPPDMQFDQEAW